MTSSKTHRLHKGKGRQPVNTLAVSKNFGIAAVLMLLAALFWIVMFFSAMAALAQVFTREEEAGTALALRLNAEPTCIYLGKLSFNLALLSTLSAVVTPMFFIFTDAPADNVLLFVLVLIMGVLALCSSTTLVAAIISKASVKGALFAVLSFPILLLPLMLLVGATDTVLMGRSLAELWAPLQGLIAYVGVMVTASLMLFKHVWQA